MSTQKLSKIVMLIGLSLVSLSSIFYLLYTAPPKTESFFAFFIVYLNEYNDFYKLILLGVFLIIASMFISVYELAEKYRELDLKELLELKNFQNRQIPLEQKQKLLAELNYVISIIEEKITSEQDSAWKWEIKLKSALFTRSRLINGRKLKPLELNDEQKSKLRKESTLLNLKEYNLNSGTDSSTVSSIKEKMALYRKHRREQV